MSETPQFHVTFTRQDNGYCNIDWRRMTDDRVLNDAVSRAFCCLVSSEAFQAAMSKLNLPPSKLPPAAYGETKCCEVT